MSQGMALEAQRERSAAQVPLTSARRAGQEAGDQAGPTDRRAGGARNDLGE